MTPFKSPSICEVQGLMKKARPFLNEAPLFVYSQASGQDGIIVSFVGTHSGLEYELGVDFHVKN